MTKFYDYFLIAAIIAFFIFVGSVMYKIVEEREELRKEFPRGSLVKMFDSGIIGKVQYTSNPYVSVLYTDELNVIHEITISPEFLTKIE